ncbi:1-hydroxy-2-methyl-2-butenyl 4-diphosphate reductase, partial [Streptacidiphilus monticola]
PQARLLRTGMGPQRARAGVGRALAQPEPAPSALVYTGFCASVRSGIRPADVLVATEVRDTVGTAAVFPQAERLAELLRGFGLSVHTGVLWSADHVVRGAERESLRRLGVAGVDMESAAALRAVPAGLPTAAVRVVVDTPEFELLRPHTLVNGVRARRSLRTVGRALSSQRSVQ